MGDVAMTVPVVHSFALQHPEMRITVLTRKIYKPLYAWAPSNVDVMGVDLKQYGGVTGLERLFREVNKRRFDAVADLHDVLRTKYLRTRFRLSGVPVAVIDKGRSEKHALIGHGCDRAALKPMFERYVDVLRALGFRTEVTFERVFDPKHENFKPLELRIGRKPAGQRWIGIAPFAAHEGKIYPLPMMEKVVRMLASQGDRVFLFGAGEKEKSILESWAAQNIQSVCGQLGGLYNEMLLMSKLDVMLAMDSANMHIAALTATPVVSIWGATHPKAGFTPWNQPMDRILQIDDLTCRPCSIYGNKPCQFGDQRCMTRITPEEIVRKINGI